MVLGPCGCCSLPVLSSECIPRCLELDNNLTHVLKGGKRPVHKECWAKALRTSRRKCPLVIRFLFFLSAGRMALYLSIQWSKLKNWFLSA